MRKSQYSRSKRVGTESESMTYSESERMQQSESSDPGVNKNGPPQPQIIVISENERSTVDD